MAKNIKELESAIKVADEFWHQYTHNDKNNASFSLFRALIDLVAANPAIDADKLEECYVTSSELAERVTELTSAKEGVYTTSRLTKEFNKLLPRLDELYPSLVQAATHLGINVIPMVDKETSKGGQGKQAIYRLLAKEVSPLAARADNHQCQHRNTAEPNQIRYYIESVPKLPLWTRWLENIDMTKHRWKMVSFTLSPIIVIILFAIIFQLAVFQIVEPIVLTYMTTFTITYVALFMIWFRYLIDALNNNITTLPDVMLPLNLKSAVLQYELNEPGSSTGRIRKLSIKVYTGKCPICGYRVDIKSIGLPFKTRLFGICDNNPLEHRYTFDFTTLKGEKMNN